MRLRNKVALVTGATQGIGQAIALRLAQEGADIAINTLHDDERAGATREQIGALGRRCVTVACDVSLPQAMRHAFEQAVESLGPVDILVNNAGIEKRNAFLDVTEADYDRVMAVNVKGPFFLSQAFAALCRRSRRRGRIINISSVHEELPFPHFTPYCVSKGGLKMMMRNLAIELAPLGITVNNIAPGAVDTPINARLMRDPRLLAPLLANIPLNRLGTPGDVAGAAAFLASDDAGYITGTTMVVDGGLLWNYAEQ
jgi:glucose 1-dehydrogenase